VKITVQKIESNAQCTVVVTGAKECPALKGRIVMSMSAISETPVTERQILLLGPYGVFGTGVIDAVAENPNGGSPQLRAAPRQPTGPRRPPPHLSVDLMDREGTTKAFSSLDKLTDLVFAAYVEKPTMAESVEPNARMLKNTLELSPRAMCLCSASRLPAAPSRTASVLGRSMLQQRRQRHVS
jgi:hypothetical protein